MGANRGRVWVSVVVGAGALLLWQGPAAARDLAVVVNEVMYEPASGRTEWVELWNRSSGTVCLRGWTLEDSRRKPALISSGPLPLGPGSFLVLAAHRAALLEEFPDLDPARARELDGAWPTLNNTQSADRPYADEVILRDAGGAGVDSVAYGADWGIPGYSIERLSPAVGSVASNWCASLSEDRASPGRVNSVFADRVPDATLLADPDPFRPELDAVTFVSFQIPFGGATARLQVFDVLGRPVRTLLDDRPVGSSGRLAWDGRDDAGSPVPTGIYILFLQAIDAGAGRAMTGKGTVAVARGF